MSVIKNLSHKYHWSRKTSFSAEALREETWYLEHGQEKLSWNVKTTYGKKIDIAAIKSRFSFDDELKSLNLLKDYFEKENAFEPVFVCPVCQSSIEDSVSEVKIWKATYRKCTNCDHAYGDIRPTSEATSKFYASQSVKPAYLDRSEVELRVQQIYAPKLAWIRSSYFERFGKYPKTLLDLGAGTGHFLSAGIRAGMSVYGLELSTSYREWAKETFDIDLSPSPEHLASVLAEPPDVITSFNVIEHFLNPSELLLEFRKFSGQNTLFVIETPRYNSLTTEIQKMHTDKIRGHIMPYEHTQLFSDSSLATLLYKNRFTVSHAWSFGQDLMELLCHFNYALAPVTADLIRQTFNPIQECLDNANVSDLIIYAGTIGKL